MASRSTLAKLKTLEAGTGPRPVPGQFVKVRYAGRFISDYKQNGPLPEVETMSLFDRSHFGSELGRSDDVQEEDLKRTQKSMLSERSVLCPLV
jgi:hypothetical protein